jgi:hypothetical protein
MDVATKNMVRLAILNLGQQVLVATEVSDAAVSGRKMREHDPRNLVLPGSI